MNCMEPAGTSGYDRRKQGGGMKITKEIKVTFNDVGVPENEEFSICLFTPAETEGAYELSVNGETFIDEYDTPHFGNVNLVVTREELVKFINLIQAELIQSEANERYLIRDLKEVADD